MSSPENELNIWDTPRLTPPSSLDKLPLADLQQWLERLERAESRHRFLMGERGQFMMRDGTEKRILTLQQELRRYEEWLQDRAEPSLRNILSLKRSASSVLSRRSAAKLAAKKPPEAKLGAERRRSLAMIHWSQNHLSGFQFVLTTLPSQSELNGMLEEYYQENEQDILSSTRKEPVHA